jgi:hypothetical protein
LSVPPVRKMFYPDGFSTGAEEPNVIYHHMAFLAQ